ncbi:MAG TPA: PilZ domain-containing protein [Candidatus Acidoferrum sp.]|nr:PilZ domain-containing protein [Candidatus Acidoferrum sp.]
MSARKIDHAGPLHQLTVEARQMRLNLSPNSVVIHKNGIEFRSAAPFAAWTEMTVTLQSPLGGGPVHCTGVVIACTGNKHAGYHVSMVFTSVSKHAQARLSTLAHSELG